MIKKIRLATIVVVMIAALILASSCTTSSNQDPIITSLEAEAEWVVPLGTLQVVCTASDPDGDELSYEWSASAGEISGDGDTATWVAGPSEGSCSVAVKVSDGHGGEVTDYVAIRVRTNNAPTIASLVANADWTTPSGSVQLTCTASDLDGDELSYEWSASGGDVSGTGAVASWTAPEQVGIYEVTVVVSDGYDSSTANSLPITVVSGQPPDIEALLITAEHCYLKEYSGGYYVGKVQIYNLECIVADTGVELFYEWSCTDGELSGESSLITWTAPDTSGYVTVTVTVSDIAGTRASKDMILAVVECSPCFFGC